MKILVVKANNRQIAKLRDYLEDDISNANRP